MKLVEAIGVRRWRRALLIAGVGYLGILLVLLLLERKMIFIPIPASRDWRDSPDPRIVDLELKASTGERIHAWWLPKEGSRNVVLYSHGNAGNLSHRGPGIVRWSTEMDASVLLYDYPGYGRSTGKPGEENCYAAAEACRTWLIEQQHVAPGDMLLVGASLGGAMAARLAERNDCRAVVLIKAFSSIPDMASHQFPWLPVRYCMRTQFDTAASLAKCDRPVFIVHGVNDRTVPFKCAQCLYDAATGQKELLTLDANDHNDALPSDFFSQLRAFLARHVP